MRFVETGFNNNKQNKIRCFGSKPFPGCIDVCRFSVNHLCTQTLAQCLPTINVLCDFVSHHFSVVVRWTVFFFSFSFFESVRHQVPFRSRFKSSCLGEYLQDQLGQHKGQHRLQDAFLNSRYTGICVRSNGIQFHGKFSQVEVD